MAPPQQGRGAGWPGAKEAQKLLRYGVAVPLPPSIQTETRKQGRAGEDVGLPLLARGSVQPT